ncbi:MAG: iron-sulfur cluster assembly scaffold protein [Chloroflexi bacterium]|nr:iron-sulfur cluster assembly scaffold protein [Chloroflexota bacterium]
MDLYQENILDHAQNPRHWHLLDPHDYHAEDENPLCGDRLELTLRVDENEIVTGVGWSGEGCAISQASASMLGEEILGKSLEDVKSISKEDILEMVGIPLSMSRMKCALLSLKVTKAAVYKLEQWTEDDD